MPSKSVKQQRFMGMVHAFQKGELKDAPLSIKKAAKSIDPDDAMHFAMTKHKGLPEKVKKKKKKKTNENMKIMKFNSDFLFESEDQPYDKKISKGFNDLSAEIEKLEVTIKNYQPKPGEGGDDLDIKYRVLADNIQNMIRDFREQYNVI